MDPTYYTGSDERDLNISDAAVHRLQREQFWRGFERALQSGTVDYFLSIHRSDGTGFYKPLVEEAERRIAVRRKGAA